MKSCGRLFLHFGRHLLAYILFLQNETILVSYILSSFFDCECHILFVPKTSLSEFLYSNARIKAKKEIEENNDSMALERQGLNELELEEQEKALSIQLIENGKGVWR